MINQQQFINFCHDICVAVCRPFGCLAIHLPACPPARLLACLPARLPACPPTRLPIDLFAHPSARPSVCPFVTRVLSVQLRPGDARPLHLYLHLLADVVPRREKCGGPLPGAAAVAPLRLDAARGGLLLRSLHLRLRKTSLLPAARANPRPAAGTSRTTGDSQLSKQLS